MTERVFWFFCDKFSMNYSVPVKVLDIYLPFGEILFTIA